MGSLERSRWASKLAGLALSLLPGTSCAACGGGGGSTRSTQPRFILLLFLSFVLAGCGGSGNGAFPAAPLNSLPVPPRTTDSNLPYSFLIQSDQSTQQQPLVLNVTDNVAQNGTPIIAYGPPFCDLPLCSGPSPVLNTPLDKNELWTFVPSSAGSTTGYFMTALGSNLALSAVPSASGGYSAELVPLQTDVLEGGGDKFQLWSVSDYNPATGQAEIVSELNGYLLYNPYTTAASSKRDLDNPHNVRATARLGVSLDVHAGLLTRTHSCATSPAVSATRSTGL
jgi:hypothetical protein